MELAAWWIRRVERLIKNSDHGAGCKLHHLLDEPSGHTPLLFGPHQVSGFEPERLIERHERTHLRFTMIKRGLVGAGCCGQFSRQHAGADERKARALAGHGESQ